MLEGDPAGPPIHQNLKRLPPEYYRGKAWVHWSMTMAHRKQGWLTESSHLQFREILLHVCHRHLLHCPAYCLMPDQAHLILMGLGKGSDQRNAAKFIRTHWNRLLKLTGHELQRQGYEHVFDDNERRPDAFEDTVLYVFHNPQRAGLVGDWQDWSYSGSVVPGYPEMPVFPPMEFWPRFWKAHHRVMDELEGDLRSDGW